MRRLFYTAVLAFLGASARAGVVDFAPVRASFVNQFVAFRPEAAAELGIAGLNDKLNIPTAANIAAQIAFFEDVQHQLANVVPQDVHEEIDFQVIRTAARSQIHALKDRKSYLVDAGAGQEPYHIVRAQAARIGDHARAKAEWAAIASRVELVPEYLAAVRENLARGAGEGRRVYRGFVEKDGIAGAASAADYFGAELLVEASEQLSPADFAELKPRLEAAGRKAREAYLRHAEFLRESVLPGATESYGIGKEEYAWKLENELDVHESPEAIRKKGREIAERVTAQMTELAKQIAPDKTLPEVMAELSAEQPKDAAEMIAAYRQVTERVRELIVKERLLTIPESDMAAAPFGKDSFLLRAHTPGLRSAPSRSHIPSAVVKNAFPGHAAQVWSRSSGVPAVRYLLEHAGSVSSLHLEGYAHYAEMLMRAHGFFTPKEELSRLGRQLKRAWRVSLDAALHTGEITMEEAARILHEKAFVPLEAAREEVARYAKMPTRALTHMIGREQIEELKAAYRKFTGSGYSEAEFHDAFLSYGPTPPSLIAPAMLENARPGSLLGRLRRNPLATVLAAIAAAALFNVGVYLAMGVKPAQEFLSAYLIEWTLSLDNIVVLAAAMRALPRKIRPRVLAWGILGAVVMRLGMVMAGMGIASAAPAVFAAFGVFLLTVAAKMLNPKWDVLGWVFKRLKSAFKPVTDLLRSPDKTALIASPFVLGLLTVMAYDVVFALDSVPAALAITKSVFIIISANVFSVLGLRSLFKVLDKLEEKFPHLQKGVAVVLFFVAAKLILGTLIGLHVGSLPSLVFVLAALGVSMLAPARKHA